MTPVWVVWWEDPDRSWESLCLSEAEADREFALRSADSTMSWGKAGRRVCQSLAAWLAGHSAGASPEVEVLEAAAKEVLRRTAANEAGPVTVRTW